MAADFTYFIAVHDVADMGLEARVTSGHGSHDGSHTSSHRHMELRFERVAEHRGNGDSIHREFLLEISDNFHCF